MKIKVTTPIKYTDRKEKYPYIGQAEHSAIVWFVSPDTGFCLDGGSMDKQGKFGDAWVESYFTPLPEGAIITLTIEP